MIDTNIKGLVTITRLVLPQMVERNSGHIINLGSMQVLILIQVAMYTVALKRLLNNLV